MAGARQSVRNRGDKKVTARAPTPPRKTFFDSWRHLLAPLASLWLVLALVDVALSVWVPGTAVRDTQLPLGARVTLEADGLLVLLAAIVVVAGPFIVAGWTAQRRGAGRRIRWPLVGIQSLVAGALLLLYGTSWALYWNAGVFLDGPAFRFWAPNPIQVFHWVYPPLALGVIVSTQVAAAALGVWLPWWTSRATPVFQRRLVVAASSVATVALVVAAVGSLAYGGETSSLTQPKPAYDVDRDDRTTPLMHLVATRGSVDLPTPTTDVTVNGARVIRRPIISMPEYLSGVEPGRLRGWNVVMVQLESLRSDQLRAYGGTRDVLPTVDALARESRVYTNAYIQASHSNYADLVPLSSQYPLRSPTIYGYPVNPPYPHVLIYEVLKTLGYRTAIVSSQNENWGGMLNFHHLDRLDHLFHAATFKGPTYAPFDDFGLAHWVEDTGSAGSVDDQYTVEDAIRWIDGVKNEPFFLHMNLQSSHVPYVVPAGFKRPFGPDKIDFPIMWGHFPMDKVNVVKDRYADSLNYEDTQLARLFTTLKELGVWDRTIVIIGGDNGEAFYEHDLASHASTLYNEVVKVPMIIRVPGVAPGFDDRPAMFLDIPPTVLDLLGAPAHPDFQGISLFEDAPNPNRAIYIIVQTPMAFQSAIVRSGYKLLYTEWDRQYFLWDLRRDPGEHDNLAASMPELVQDLAGRLMAWRREQLAYYASPARQAREYPPVIED